MWMKHQALLKVQTVNNLGWGKGKWSKALELRWQQGTDIHFRIVFAFLDIVLASQVTLQLLHHWRKQILIVQLFGRGNSKAKIAWVKCRVDKCKIKLFLYLSVSIRTSEKDLRFWIACKNIEDFFPIFFTLSRKKMGLGFLVEQIYLVSSGNYDPHAKIWGFSGFFIYRALLDCTSKPQDLLYNNQDVKISTNTILLVLSNRRKYNILYVNRSIL